MSLQVNENAPSFSLPNQDNAEMSLGDFRGSWVILYFYPKDKTPGCTKEACDFRDHWEVFRKSGAVILGVSPDSPNTHKSFIEKENLNFTLLSDTHKEVAKLYEAFGTKKLYGKEYEGVLRSTFLIDPQGKIAFIWKNVKVEGHIQEVFKVFSELTRESL